MKPYRTLLTSRVAASSRIAAIGLDRLPQLPWRGVLAAFLLSLVAPAGAVEFIVDRADGEVFIKNNDAVPFSFDGYTLSSSSDGLFPDQWVSVTGNYDLAGDGSVDANSNWITIGPATVSALAEASLTAGTGLLEAGQIVSLGAFYDVSLSESLMATVSNNLTVTGPFAADFRTLTADYDNDLDVDVDDYGIFANTFGSTTDLRADGNADGVVNAIDYTVWRDSEELSLAPAAFAELAFVSASTFGATIPEPTALLLTIGLLATNVSSKRRR